jgi:hypothetical protein
LKLFSRFLKIVVNVKVFIGGAAEEELRERQTAVAAPVMKTCSELNRNGNFGYGD